MPTKRLPTHANIDHLKYQAKDLLKTYRTEQLDAYQRVREFHPHFKGVSDSAMVGKTFTLTDAQLSIAREYGFASWPRLTRVVSKQCGVELVLSHHERINDELFRQAVDLLDEGDIARLRHHLTIHPQLVGQRIVFEGGNYFTNPSLLAFIAENPIRHNQLPSNIVEVARLILDAGAAEDQSSIDGALMLVSTGCVVRKSGVQVPLINLLCGYGGNPDNAISAAVCHGEFEAADALIECGGSINLIVAAATHRLDDVRTLVNSADAREKHMALAVASLHGHAMVVELLLKQGESPNRFNPEGCHSHSTPLHQAALAGHLDVVQLLVQNGARLDIRDIHHRGTALDWAEHAEQNDIVKYFRRQS